MKNKRKAIIAVVSATALFLTIGATTYAATTTTNPLTGQRHFIWDILTPEQKTQVTDQAKTQLDQRLADGSLTQEQYDQALDALQNGSMPMMSAFGGRGHRGMMNPDNFNFNNEFNDKWNALTDQQKDAIYDLEDDKAAIDAQIIDKYEEYGVIDGETADQWQANMEARRSQMRTDGRMPFGGKGMRGFFDNPVPNPDTTTPSTTTPTGTGF